jgi:hypothetical protein
MSPLRREGPHVKTRTACLAAVLVVCTALTTACEAGAFENESATPSYKIALLEHHGRLRTVKVEVHSSNGLEAVFDDVTAGLDENAAYFVEIHCSDRGRGTGGNLLARGAYAVGTAGASYTGLEQGDSHFERLKGATCP